MFPDQVIALDSRHNLLDFPGVTLATPNEPEIKKFFPEKKFLNDNDFFDAGGELLDRLDAKGVVSEKGTQGDAGFSTRRKTDCIGYIRNFADRGCDRCRRHGPGRHGVGDWPRAPICMHSRSLANIAGGLVVMHEGAYPLPRRELQDALPQ